MGSLILVRFLIGVGEAAALPNFNRAVANWLGPHERGIGIGIAIGGIGIGSAITPPLTAWIMVNFWMANGVFMLPAFWGSSLPRCGFGMPPINPATILMSTSMNLL